MWVVENRNLRRIFGPKVGEIREVGEVSDIKNFRDLYILGYNALQSVLSQPTFYMKKKAIFFSETSVDLQRGKRRYIPDDRTLHSYRYENLGSYIGVL
jgi:hypothetical protein